MEVRERLLEIWEVWKKGNVVSGYNEAKYRKDACGAWMMYDKYGNRDSPFGWEIDHIIPKSKGGDDVLSNYRPLQWKNNASKQDGRLSCVIVSSGDRNIP